MMIDPESYLKILFSNEVEFFTGVPDSLLKHFCCCVDERAKNHLIAANEGSAMGLAIGHHLATGKLPLVYMQNSGLGNIVNPLLSLASKEVYGIPMLLLLGWRGQPGVKDEPQHVHQGRVMIAMLDAMDVPYSILSSDLAEAAAQTEAAVRQAKAGGQPVALIVEKDSFKVYDPTARETDNRLSREKAIVAVASEVGGDAAIVCTTGMPSRELYEHRQSLAQGHKSDFLTVGGMGHASQIALGLALEQPERLTVCIDGDGAALMHLGSMAIIGQAPAPNFLHIILNNGAHASVGGQPTVGMQISFTGMAKAAGYGYAATATTIEEVKMALSGAMAVDGPRLVEIIVSAVNRKDIGRPTTTPKQNKEALMHYLSAPL